MSSTCDDGSEQSSRAGNAGRSLAKTAARKGTKSGAKWVFAILGVKGIAIVGAILLVLLLIAAAAGALKQQAAAATPPAAAAMSSRTSRIAPTMAMPLT